MTELEYLNAILSVNEGDMEGLWFTTQNYHPIRANVLCSDFFHWACADCEVIEHEDIESFVATWNWHDAWIDLYVDSFMAESKRRKEAGDRVGEKIELDETHTEVDWMLLWATWKRKYVPDTLNARVERKNITPEVAEIFKRAATGEKFWETILP